MKNPTAAQNRGQVQTSASPRNTSPNKLDQILRLLKKFNDDMYPPEECEEKGISQPITLVLLSSGAGVLNDTYNFDRILAFESADELEHFLKTTRREQASMIRAGGAREVRNG